MLRLVLDTNVWLDWLVFDDPSAGPLKAAVEHGRAEVVVDDEVLAELARVLAYPFGARTLGAQAQSDAIARCLQVARKNEQGAMKDSLPSLPKCADPDDQKFLELAAACRANYLLTRDDALLVLARGRARALPFRIVTPREFAATVATANEQG